MPMSGPRIGQRFGSFELIQFLGRGGFAEVYLGQNMRLHNQKAAVKILEKERVLQNSEAFEKEAGIIATLSHPHIVKMYDYNLYSNVTMILTLVPYIIMEYAPKGSLRKKHPRNVPLPLPTIASYTRQIASALHFAHNSGVMHLDVKPENILINNRDELLLSDFGLATLLSEKDKQADVQGTVSYMSPEQLNGKPDFASDQYALGIMVYEWIGGSVPFTGRSITEVIEKHMKAPPPSLCAQVPTLPPAVEAVVMKALSKAIPDRFVSVNDFAQALEQAINKARSSSNVYPDNPQNIVAGFPGGGAGGQFGGTPLRQTPPTPVVGPSPVPNQTPFLGFGGVPNPPTPQPQIPPAGSYPTPGQGSMPGGMQNGQMAPTVPAGQYGAPGQGPAPGGMPHGQGPLRLPLPPDPQPIPGRGPFLDGVPPFSSGTFNDPNDSSRTINVNQWAGPDRREVVNPPVNNVSEIMSQSMIGLKKIIQPTYQRKPLMLLFAGIVADVIACIFIGVWLGRAAGINSGWLGFFFFLVGSAGAFYLLILSENAILKAFLSFLIAIIWGFFGYAFATLIGAGAFIAFLPDPNTMSVLFLFGSLGLHLYFTFKRK